MNSAVTPATLSLDEVKGRILSDHRQIRIFLDELSGIIGSISVQKEADHAERQLTDPVWRLFLFFDEHLGFEEKQLVPLLLDSGAWGTIRARRLMDEHKAQRGVLRSMIKDCDGNLKRGPQLLEDARWLVDSFRKDMTAEENELETIRDDGFVADQFTG
jgi:hypothetical protein